MIQGTAKDPSGKRRERDFLNGNTETTLLFPYSSKII